MKNPEITNPAHLLEKVNAFRNSRIILTADELGVFNQLHGHGNSSSFVADRLGADHRATDRLLNALVALGLLDKHKGVFQNTAFSNNFLVKGSAEYLGGLSLSNQTWKTWSTLSEAVIKGTTIAMESPINERTPEWQESFIAAMHARAGVQAKEAAEVLDLEKARSILDVGGGSGAFAFAIIRRNQSVKATIFDLPNIIPLTRKYIQLSGLSDQVDTVTGNYLTDDLGVGYDLVLMSAIVHINSPEENQLLIRNGAEALNSGGQLVVLDHIMNDDRTEPAVGAFFALNMLVGTFHGDTYTEAELRSWMEDAGLTGIQVKITASGNQLMVGKKA
ncbi:MAG: methyltransferase [Bacteroidales bacterium]|nr:methyltransferase [Bacteroidales bacterium]